MPSREAFSERSNLFNAQNILPADLDEFRRFQGCLPHISSLRSNASFTHYPLCVVGSSGSEVPLEAKYVSPSFRPSRRPAVNSNSTAFCMASSATSEDARPLSPAFAPGRGAGLLGRLPIPELTPTGAKQSRTALLLLCPCCPCLQLTPCSYSALSA